MLDWKRVLVTTLLVLFTALTSSAESRRVKNAYAGAALPADQVAVLTIDKVVHPRTAMRKGYEETVLIFAADGIETGEKMHGWPDAIHLKPGTNRVDVAYMNTKYTESPLIFLAKASKVDRREIEITTVAGHHYLLRFRSDGAKLAENAIWVEDIASGEVAGGTRAMDGAAKASAVAVVRAERKIRDGGLVQHGDETVVVQKVDGAEIGNAGKGWPNEVELEPGPRTLSVTYVASFDEVHLARQARQRENDRLLKFDAVAGRRYLIRFESVKFTPAKIWIEDALSGETVATATR